MPYGKNRVNNKNGRFNLKTAVVHEKHEIHEKISMWALLGHAGNRAAQSFILLL
jgi:hypothetical protein